MEFKLLPRVIVGLVVGLGIGIGFATVVVLSGALAPRQTEATHGGSSFIHACVHIFTYNVRFKLPGQDATCNVGEFPLDVPSAGAFGDLDDRLTALEAQVPDCLSEDGNLDAVFEGCNVRVSSGSGTTDGVVNGKGNLIIGYNENDFGGARTGSHNLVVAPDHSYWSYGGLVAGLRNTLSGAHATVSAGFANTASGFTSSVSGGELNIAGGDQSSVTGGFGNAASGIYSSVSGGEANIADGNSSSVSGGLGHTISLEGFAPFDHDWIAGTLVQDF